MRGAHTPHRQEGFPQLRRQLRLGLGFEGRHAHRIAGGQEHHVAGGEFLAEKARSYWYSYDFKDIWKRI